MTVVDLSTISMAAGQRRVTGPIRLDGGVMAVKAGFQCRAAGWHSDEDNDVFVSHWITQQTHSHRAGVGGLGLRAPCPQNVPVGHKQSKGLAFSVQRSSSQCRKDKRSRMLTFQMFTRYISSREQLFQLSNMAWGSS